MKAKKKYGQHFLINEGAIEQISNAILSSAKGIKNITEVGPGKGAISSRLITSDNQIKFIEIDPDMVYYLIKNLNIDPDHIVQENILDTNPYELFNGEPFVLSGNYPYNISSQILFWMMSAHEIIPEMIGMFQKEVAVRICSEPGNKQYGILSVLVQAIYDVKIILKLSAGSFSPPPKVDSAVIRCSTKPNLVIDYNQKLFKRIVKATFNHRRKMISNTLKGIVKDESVFKEEIFRQRPEHLAVKDFIYLTNLLEGNVV